MDTFNKISVVGLGYIGLPTAAIFANQGVEIAGTDTEQKVVDSVNAGRPHFGEPNLDALVRRVVETGKLSASTEVRAAEAFLVTVPTPLRAGAGSDPGADLSHVRAAAAYLKARLATELPVPTEGGVYITVKNADKYDVIPLAQELEEMGFTIYATRGTSHVLRDSGGVDVQTCYRITEGLTPDALDLIRQGKIHLIINTPRNTGGAVLDGNMMRRLAVELNIPFVTTMAGARMEVRAIDEAMQGIPEPRLLEIGTLG